jgi:tetratricopeptide (TPR) repeat protein
MRVLLVLAVLATAASAGPRPKPKPTPTPVATPTPAPTPSPAPSEQRVRADKLFEDGRKYLANKEYALACTAFEQSQEADPAIGTQLNIALCYEQWGHFASAYHAYIDAEKIATEKADDRAKYAHKKVDELQPKIPHLRIDVPDSADPGAVFLLDGKEIKRTAFADELLLDAGSHTIEATVPGRTPKTAKIELQNGEHQRLKIDVPKAEVFGEVPRKAGRFYGGIAMLAGGAVVVGVASYVTLLARSDYNDALAQCPNTVCATHDAYKTTQDARSRANLMTFVGGAGIAIAGVGMYYLLTSKGDRPPEHVTAFVAPGAAGVAYGATW